MRSGRLFKNRFKRDIITDEDHLRKLILFIHTNSVHHTIETDYKTCKYSSFNAIVSDQSTLIWKDKVLDLFHNKENFIYCHNQNTGFENNPYKGFEQLYEVE